jgi:hypothetical protein
VETADNMDTTADAAQKTVRSVTLNNIEDNFTIWILNCKMFPKNIKNTKKLLTKFTGKV